MNNNRLKFRAWRDNTKTMTHPATLHDLMTKYGQMNKDGLQWMQFTGLYDCDGVEVYEGDIVKCNNGHIGVVEWESHDATFNVSDYYCSSNDFPTMAFIEGQPFEVIGNIHQHTHLLDGGGDS